VTEEDTRSGKTRVAGICGSPRQGGNSDTLLDAALTAAEGAGADVRRIYLRDLDFVPCQNCGYCSQHGVCRIQDDMTTVYAALDGAGVVLLAAPIYFCSLSAQAKAMIDRCQPYWARKYVLKQEPPRTGRVGGFLSCGGSEDDRFLACTERIVKSWYYVLGVDYGGCVFVPGLDKLGDAAGHPTATRDAAAFGRKLIRR